MRMRSQDARKAGGWLARGLIVIAGLSACDDSTTVRIPADDEVVALVEVTFSDVGDPTMSATVIVAETHADLEQRRSSGVSADTILRFQAIVAGVFDHIPAGRRYIHATFRVPAALDSIVADSVLENLILVPVATARTVPGTPVRTLLRRDRSAADTSFALQLQVTGRARLDQDGNVQVDSASVLRLLSDDDIEEFDLPLSVTRFFPAGFVVHDFGVPAAGLADGVVTLAFSLPLHDDDNLNPHTFSIVLAAVRHTR